MTTLVLIFFAALACVFAATPLLRRLAFRIGFLDRPAARKIHSSPVPLLGGVAIYFAVTLSLLLLRDYLLGELIAVLMGATVISLTGLMDDRKALHSSIKLLVQVLVAAGLYAGGIRVQLDWLPEWINVLLTLFWMVGITNAFNLLDNMDGLSAGLASLSAAFFTLFAVSQGQYLVSALAASILGASMGFLFFNSYPASIFMGDSGSLLLGFMLACIGIKLRFPQEPSWVSWIIPIAVLWVPIFDTFLVTFSRLRRGKNPLTTPGRDHISHRLVAMGMSQRSAVFLIYAAGLLCGMAALGILLASPQSGVAIGCAVLLISARILWRWELAAGKGG